MKLVIHVGPPKTGTTALQRALYGARHRLLAHQILYPEPGRRKRHNHGELCYTFLPFDQAPRGMKKYSERDYIQSGKALMREIEHQIESHKPDLLVLSSEWFARLYKAKDSGKFMAYLEALSPKNIEFVLYARRPSEFFLSSSQQRLRAASLFEPIYPWNFDVLVDGLKDIVGQYPVTVRLFDRKSMIGGSIVSDFAALYFPRLAEELKALETKRPANESFSAETMVLLQKFRRAFYPHEEDVFNERTRKLLRRLQKIDAKDGNPRPKLRSTWKDYLDYGHSGALDLRDKHGVSFPDFDYARLERQDFATKPDANADVANIIVVDQERLNRQIDALSRSLWAIRPSNSKWLRDVRRCLKEDRGQLRRHLSEC
ncbi:hypothetical protein HKCCE4037_07635 [Rhodobacterales bacterium HKCCE4037]|nr:hypothetical protein [Rhodobacterales bacterium HKCCE4037]